MRRNLGKVDPISFRPRETLVISASASKTKASHLARTSFSSRKSDMESNFIIMERNPETGKEDNKYVVRNIQSIENISQPVGATGSLRFPSAN